MIQTVLFYASRITNDLKDKYKFVINRWHLHIPIGIAIYIALFYILNLTFDGIPFVVKHIITTILDFIGCGLFELYQQRGRIIDEKERIESNKDLLVSVPPILIIMMLIGFIRNGKDN